MVRRYDFQLSRCIGLHNKLYKQSLVVYSTHDLFYETKCTITHLPILPICSLYFSSMLFTHILHFIMFNGILCSLGYMHDIRLIII